MGRGHKANSSNGRSGPAAVGAEPSLAPARGKLLRRPAVGTRAGHEAAAVPPSAREVLVSPGRPLDPQVRGLLEPRFGHDFGNVRVHTDPSAAESARELGARAYTLGDDVVFAAGQYKPSTREGQRLIAHELAHTIQRPPVIARQSDSGTIPVGPLKLSPEARRKALAYDPFKKRKHEPKAPEMGPLPVPTDMTPPPAAECKQKKPADVVKELQDNDVAGLTEADMQGDINLAQARAKNKGYEVTPSLVGRADRAIRKAFGDVLPKGRSYTSKGTVTTVTPAEFANKRVPDEPTAKTIIGKAAIDAARETLRALCITDPDDATLQSTVAAPIFKRRGIDFVRAQQESRVGGWTTFSEDDKGVVTRHVELPKSGRYSGHATVHEAMHFYVDETYRKTAEASVLKKELMEGGAEFMARHVLTNYLADAEEFKVNPGAYAREFQYAQVALLPRGGLSTFKLAYFQGHVDLLGLKPVKKKSVVSEPGDEFEREADRVAEEVTGTEDAAPPLKYARRGLAQRKCACGAGAEGECEECGANLKAVQRKPSNDTATGAVPAAVGHVLRSPGQALDHPTRALMESRFGHDFGRVRVHTGAAADESARSVNALAYTHGHDVVFRAGQYSPSTTPGRKLLAHELAHVVQQGEAEHAARASAGVGNFAPPLTKASASGGATVRRQTAAPASAAAATDEAPSAPAVTPETRLPFKSTEFPGLSAGWDAAAILKVTKINPDSEFGKAVAEGPDSVLPIIKRLHQQAEAGRTNANTSMCLKEAYLRVWAEAMGLGLRMILTQATYGELTRVADINEMMSAPGAERDARLVRWSRETEHRNKAAAAGQKPAAPRRPPAPGPWNKVYDTPRSRTLLSFEKFKGGLGEIMPTTQGGLSKNEAIELKKRPGTGIPAPPSISYELLKKIYPKMASDAAADKEKEAKAQRYLANLNKAFRLMKINTVEAQANYLTHAYIESDQFRQFTETQGSTRVKGGTQKWLDDPEQIELDVKDLAGRYPLGGTVNPHGEFEFIGRGPVQATHSHQYVEVIALLEVAAEQYERESDAGDPEACDFMLLARDAANAIKADPRQAANPEYTFLVSAAFMKKRGADVSVARTSPGQTWTGDDAASGWVAGGLQAAGSPQAKALGDKSAQYPRIFDLLLDEAERTNPNAREALQKNVRYRRRLSEFRSAQAKAAVRKK